MADHFPFSLFTDLSEEPRQDSPPSMNWQQNGGVVEGNIPNGGNGGISCQQNEQVVENDEPKGNNGGQQNEQFVENDDPNQSIGGQLVTEENKSLVPVLPGDSGEGLPYAPINWPNLGDNWSWRVGKRFNSSGYFQDRFLFPPKRFQRTRNGRQFGSKIAVENYIRSEFPGEDVTAFFASFSWKIPVKVPSATKEESISLPLEDPPQDGIEKVQEGREEIPRSTLRKRKQSASTPSSTSKRQTKEKAATPASTSKRQTKQKSATPASTSKRQTKQNAATSSSTSKRKTRQFLRHTFTTNEESLVTPQESIVNIPEDFDNYLNSLDDILAQPLSETAISNAATIDSLFAEDEMAEARSRLSSLLVMDFRSLVSSKYFTELTTLATKLRKDPRLSAEQLVKLKLIEEFQSFREVFLESRQTIEQADKFSATLERNKAKVTSLKSEYNELKEKADQLQTQVDSSLEAVKEIDDQIAQLQSWRADLMNRIESNKSAKVEVTSTQKAVAGAIPAVVHEVQQANSRLPEWELKKKNAENREAEILEKFAPLQGFSL